MSEIMKGFVPPTLQRFAWPTAEPIVAEVPAVKLTHRDWQDIQTIIRSLGTLQKRIYGVNMETAIISGAAIAEEARLAEELVGRLGIAEEE